MTDSVFRTSDFDFELPEHLIAQFPAVQRHESRLLRVDSHTGALKDSVFVQLPEFLNAGDLLVFNDTRVIKARLLGRKDSGGSVEVLIERLLNEKEALAHIRASKSPRPGTLLIFEDGISATMLERQGSLFRLRFEASITVSEVLERQGKLPLPPYIQHSPDAVDESRYQTVYARHPGSVAAPTAGLHFDETLLAKLLKANIKIAYVTLHVGAGTFQPVRAEFITDHQMHSERYEVPEATVEAIQTTRASGGRVVAVGTTALRTLESAAKDGHLQSGWSETNIFIYPGFNFNVVDRLITNFHLPKSTLLMLVSAFAGIETIRSAYQHAIAEQYRFFSYGDAMLLDRVDDPLSDSISGNPCA